MIIAAGTGIVQACLVVDDLDAAIANWISGFGAGPFFVQRNMRVPVEYRGTPSELNVHVALGQCGDLQIELIELASTEANVYRDMFPNGGGGFHHVAIFVDDFEERVTAYERDGSATAAIGLFNGTGFAYMDTREKLGFFTELFEESPAMRTFFANIAAAARDWDGTAPVRPLADAAP